MPLKSLQFLIDNNIKGKIFAPYYISGYIAYKFYPDFLIYIDGRQEQVYDYDLFDREMFFTIGVGKNHKKILDDYNHDIILVDKKFDLEKRMKEFSKWIKIYEDNKSLIYVKKNIQKFKYDKIDKTEDEIMDSIFDSYFL